MSSAAKSKQWSTLLCQFKRHSINTLRTVFIGMFQCLSREREGQKAIFADSTQAFTLLMPTSLSLFNAGLLGGGGRRRVLTCREKKESSVCFLPPKPTYLISTGGTIAQVCSPFCRPGTAGCGCDLGPNWLEILAGEWTGCWSLLSCCHDGWWKLKKWLHCHLDGCSGPLWKCNHTEEIMAILKLNYTI